MHKAHDITLNRYSIIRLYSIQTTSLLLVGLRGLQKAIEIPADPFIFEISSTRGKKLHKLFGQQKFAKCATREMSSLPNYFFERFVSIRTLIWIKIGIATTAIAQSF